MVYDYLDPAVGACLSGSSVSLRRCFVVEVLTRDDVIRLFTTYPRCSLSQTADTATLDCTGNCGKLINGCWACDAVYKTNAPDGCYWSPR